MEYQHQSLVGPAQLHGRPRLADAIVLEHLRGIRAQLANIVSVQEKRRATEEEKKEGLALRLREHEVDLAVADELAWRRLASRGLW